MECRSFGRYAGAVVADICLRAPRGHPNYFAARHDRPHGPQPRSSRCCGRLASSPPPPAFAAAARDPAVPVMTAVPPSADDPEGFWADRPRELGWFTPWQRVLEWNAPWAKWFVGGKLNVAYNCVDRHAHSARRNKAAIIWEGEPGDSRVLTYGDARARGEPLCQRAAIARRRQGRPRRDLHGHGSRAGHRHARLRANRRAAQRRLRRIFAPRRCASASTTPRPKWSSPPTAPGGAAPSCRSRPAWTKRCAERRPSKKSSWCDASAKPRRSP